MKTGKVLTKVLKKLELDQDVPESAWSDSDMIAQCNAWFVQWARILLLSFRVPGLVLESQTTNVSLPDFANCLKETSTSRRAPSLAKRPQKLTQVSCCIDLYIEVNTTLPRRDKRKCAQTLILRCKSTPQPTSSTKDV